MDRRALKGWTAGPDSAAVLVDDLLADVQQSQAHAGEAAIVHVGRSAETLEDVAKVTGRNPNPLIGDGEIQAAFLAPEGDPHLAAVWTVFHGVLDQAI